MLAKFKTIAFDLGCHKKRVVKFHASMVAEKGHPRPLRKYLLPPAVSTIPPAVQRIYVPFEYSVCRAKEVYALCVHTFIFKKTRHKLSAYGIRNIRTERKSAVPPAYRPRFRHGMCMTDPETLYPVPRVARDRMSCRSGDPLPSH